MADLMKHLSPILGEGFAGRLRRNLSLVLGSSIFSSGCAIASLAINARALGPAEFGILALIQAYVALLASFFTFGSWQPIIRLGSRYLRLGVMQLFGITVSCGITVDILTSLAAGLTGLITVFLLADLIGISQEYLGFTAIYSLSLFFGLGGTPKGVFRLVNRFDILVGFQMTHSVLLVIIAVILWSVGATLLVYVITLATYSMLYKVFLFIRLLVYLHSNKIPMFGLLKLRQRKVFVRHFLAMSIGTGLLSTLTDVRRHAELFLVASLLGEAGAGMYAIASRVVNIIPRLIEPVRQVLFPEIATIVAGQDRGEITQLVIRMTSIIAIVSLLLVLVGTLLSKTIIIIGFGEQYKDAISTFVILLAGGGFTAASVHLNPLIQTLTGTKPLLWIAGVSIAVYFPLTVILVNALGLDGAAWASLFIQTLTYVLMLFVTRILLRFI